MPVTMPILRTLGLAAALAGMAQAAPRIEVTRFHNNPPPPGQTITLLPAPGQALGELEAGAQANVLRATLVKLGFQPVAPGQPADVVATFKLASEAVGQERRGPPVTIGIGGSTGGWRGGIGGGVTFPVGGNRTRTILQTTLQMQMRRAADNVAVWEGRAVESGAGGNPANRLPVLADALLRDYPGANGQTVKVKAR